MGKWLLFAGALAALSQPASAANWVHFADCGSAGQQRTYWYDTDRVRSRGAKKVVRIRGDYSRVAGSSVAGADIVWTLDCSNRSFVEQQRTERRKDGKVLGRYTKATRAMRVQADSVADKLADRLCA